MKKTRTLLAGIISISVIFSGVVSVCASDNYICGDINGDSVIDLTDLSELSLALLGDKSLTDEQIKAADINENGKADLTDLARMKQYVSNAVSSLKSELSGEKNGPSDECGIFEFNGEKCFSYVQASMDLTDELIYADQKAMLIDSAEKLEEITAVFSSEKDYEDSGAVSLFESSIKKITGYAQPDDEYFKNNAVIFAWGREMNYNYDMEIDHLEMPESGKISIMINRFTHMCVLPACRNYGYFISVPVKSLEGMDTDSAELVTVYNEQMVD